ncbi:ADP-ribosylglycohydrolase family protein, partial [Singulisphaera rosea]
TMGFPPACIPTCLYILLTTDSFEDGLIEMVNLGGDADSTGAILGALMGAHYGVQPIPERWLDGLRNHEGVDTRARALAERSAVGIKIPALVATEHQLSELESHFRDHLIKSAPISPQNGGDLGANRRM